MSTQLNERLARGLGYTRKTQTITRLSGSAIYLWQDPNGLACELPDWSGDLNEIAKLERRLNTTQTLIYAAELCRIVNDAPRRGTENLPTQAKLIFATAAQRAKALLVPL